MSQNLGQIIPNIQIGTVTEGVEPSVVNVGTGLNPVLNFTLQKGENGQGVPSGGTTGQILAKASNTDYDTEWVNGTTGSVDWSDITNKPNFATVSTSGSYNDLTDKPTINNYNWLIYCKVRGTAYTYKQFVIDLEKNGSRVIDGNITIYEVDTATGETRSALVIQISTGTLPISPNTAVGIVNSNRTYKFEYWHTDETTQDRVIDSTKIISNWENDWTDITNKPTAFPPESHTHEELKSYVDNLVLSERDGREAGDDILRNRIDALGNPDWTDIQNKPSTFPPESHNHTKSQITDFPSTITLVATLQGGTTQTFTLYGSTS